MSKEQINTVFHIWFHLSRLFWSRRWCNFPLIWLLLCLLFVPVTPWFISCDDFGQKIWISFQLIFYFTAHIQTIGSLILREQARNEFRSKLVWCEVLLLKFVAMSSSTKLQSLLPTRRLFDDDQTLSHPEFFECFRRICLVKDAQIAVGLQVTCHHVWTEKTIRKPLPGSKLLL